MIFWNAGSSETTRGLDILGIRILDQNLELDWVGGLTTVSPRARYFSLIPWLLGAFSLETGAGATEGWRFDRNNFLAALKRMEFVVLAASQLQGANLADDTTGILNSMNYREILNAFNQEARFEGEFAKGGTSLNIYSSPARSFGLIANDPEDVFPFRVVGLGKEIHDCRESALRNSPLRQYVLQGGLVTRQMVEEEGHWFSVNGLHHASCSAERELLERAFFIPSLHGQTAEGYANFRSTVLWVLQSCFDQPNHADGLLVRNFQAILTDERNEHQAVRWAWQEYELRRRIHYAQELLLTGLVDLLESNGPMPLTGAIHKLTEDSAIPSTLIRTLGVNQFRWTLSIEDFYSTFDSDKWWRIPLPPRQVGLLSPGDKAIFAIALMVVSHRQASHRRTEAGQCLQGSLPDWCVCQIFDQIFIERGHSLVSLLRFVLEHMVIQPHLVTTLRKMGEGQKCSLRLYVEEGLLCPTGIRIEAGYSITRLTSLLSVLADIGFLRHHQNGYETSDRGWRFLREFGALR